MIANTHHDTPKEADIMKTSWTMAREKADRQALENAATWMREQLEQMEKYLIMDNSTGALYWMYGED